MKSYATLNLNGDFRRAYARGKSFADPALVTYALKTRRGVCRMGITVSKKVGCAVERNRCKRVIRAAFRDCCEEITGGWDLVFVARGRTKYLKSTVIRKIMRRQLIQAGAIRGKSENVDMGR